MGYQTGQLGAQDQTLWAFRTRAFEDRRSAAVCVGDFGRFCTSLCSLIPYNCSSGAGLFPCSCTLLSGLVPCFSVQTLFPSSGNTRTTLTASYTLPFVSFFPFLFPCRTHTFPSDSASPPPFGPPAVFCPFALARETTPSKEWEAKKNLWLGKPEDFQKV